MGLYRISNKLKARIQHFAGPRCVPHARDSDGHPHSV